ENIESWNFVGTSTSTVSEVPAQIDIPIGSGGASVTITVPSASKAKIIAEDKAKAGHGAINPDKGEGVAIVFAPNKAQSEYINSTYKIRVFNLMGELVDEFSKIPLQADDVWIKWIPDDLASGIYVVYIKGPGVEDSKKVAVLR
ncbi:MAG: hypothetical protein ABII23_00510, partial [bacterium]